MTDLKSTYFAALFLIITAATPLSAQRRVLSGADSVLVGRILLAEDRRDSTDAALALGQRHADTRIRLLAVRAAARTRDSAFATRDSLPPLREPKRWPNVAWRARYRSLKSQGDDCTATRAALADRAWPVRLRGADLVTTACAADESLTSTLRNWIDALPSDVTRRNRGTVSWHAAAHALVALSKLQPAEAATRLPKLAGHGQWQFRVYSARAAAILADAATLRILARDANPNVAETAIEALSKLTKHADDDLFVTSLQRNEAQVVRVAALALAGSPRADVMTAANTAFDRWVSRANASERDVRLALLAASGRPGSDDRPPPVRALLPPTAIALALGADLRLRVTMSPASGGGSFTVRMRGDIAPIAAARVVELADAGYYDGLVWHRVEHDFVIQGGSPGANEYVGSDRYFRDELGTVPHARGTVGMSTRGHDTGDAQWFVNLSYNPRLGRDYTVFAEVVERMDVVDGILEGDVIARISRIQHSLRR